MRFGVSTFVTDEGIEPSVLGPALEERGFASLYLAEHTHVPVARATPYPGGGDLPRQYYRTLDPFVALTAAGVVTERLELGTGIALINQRDPILLAKETASLDLITGGRAVLGIGAGWNREEMLHHGTDPKTRMARMREYVLAVKEIWANDQAEFHGEFVDFDPIFSWPKPVRRPPVLVGGWGPKTLDRVVEYGDGWMPVAGRDRDGVLAGAVADLRARAGRHVPVVAYAARPEPDAVEQLTSAGVDEILFFLPTEPADETLRRLDRMAELI
ncbi:LLM class F420-dependent oxidoreductase [Actinoallomurus iriomotensis]|uniref:LLM class F420-dependent oxidoreductase n=1 Tax=Actinoallomurus iriomotensis TaxID=478107 RepID=UPI00255415FB|nr:LLM class F420-dependent oxidoreductase [Actinoallomurus iriomotensis]